MRAQSSELRAIASALDTAASHKTMPAATDMRATSPALDTWIAANLAAARKEKNAAARAADLRAVAASLRNAAGLASRSYPSEPKHLSSDVATILAEPAFRTAPQSRPAAKTEPSWFARMWLAFLTWWGKLLGHAFVAAANTPIFGNIAAFVLLILAPLILLILIIRIAMVMAARPRRARGPTADGTPLEVFTTAGETYDAACAAARRGAFGLAIALLFQAALVALDRSGRVPYDSARTAGEYRRAVRRSAAGMAGPFEALSKAFTYVAYAEAPADESDWRAADAAFASMSFGPADTL
ncbi:MAG TPA: DUF4129 domain-containing protein [Candidatus Eremiobacteraceae bacterium]|nr:DUF4129 domain-containing protein [Candidatus Eremiobacteraceae bacterium]